MNKLCKYLVFKYLRLDKDQPFISLCTILAFLGVCVGVCVLIVAMAIMNGFDKDFKERFMVMNYPISIMPKIYDIDQNTLKNLKAQFPDLAFAPYLSTNIIINNNGYFEGAILQGIKAQDEKKINKIVREGLGDKELKNYEALVGAYIKNDDKLNIILPQISPAGISFMPKIKRLDPKYSFNSGLIHYDKSYIYIDIDALLKLLNRTSYDAIHVGSNDINKDINRLKEYLGDDYTILAWWEQNGSLFAALELEKKALFIVLMLIILIASLNITSSLIMIIMSRRAEIALLLSFGASKKDIKNIFLSLGSLIGGAGIICGVILAFVALWALSNFDIIHLPAEVYGSSKLPLDLSLLDFSLIIIGAIIIILISSYYPAKKASNIDILHTLRNE